MIGLVVFGILSVLLVALEVFIFYRARQRRLQSGSSRSLWTQPQRMIVVAAVAVVLVVVGVAISSGR